MQNGLPPSYEDYLCHKYAMFSRSHTPPPPWSDSTQSSNIQLTERDTIPSQSELREYLVQLSLENRNDPNSQHNLVTMRDTVNLANSHQALRKHVRQQRLRAMAPRWVLFKYT